MSELRARRLGPRLPRPRPRRPRRRGRARPTRRAATASSSAVAGGGPPFVRRRPECSCQQSAGLTGRLCGETAEGRELEQLEIVLAHGASVRPNGALHCLPRCPTIFPVVRYRESAAAAGRHGVALRRWDGVRRCCSWTGSTCRASLVPLARAGGGPRGPRELLRPGSRRRPSARHRLRARGMHVARDPAWGARLGYPLEELPRPTGARLPSSRRSAKRRKGPAARS